MRLSLNTQSFENKNNNYYLDSDHCGRNNWTHTMNALYKISYGLFALAIISGLLTYLVATFLFFTSAVIVLAMAVAIDDTDEER